MRIKNFLIGTVSSCLLALVAQPSLGQLYSEDFDTNSSSNWTVNDSTDTDFNTDIFFDYSTVGIPSAPNSAGGSTRGMKLQANLFSGAFGGFSVSPNGESFSGDYVLSYDMWQSYQPVTFIPPTGEFPSGGGIIQGQSSGGTNLGYGGIMSAGDAINSPGTVDGVFFAATTDGDSGSDFRVYSSDIPESYQLPVRPEQPKDSDATYLAGSRNNTADLYVNNFGAETPTAAQTALFPNHFTAHADNVSAAGTLGYAWHEHTITKDGDMVTWKVDGIKLIELDTSNFTTPTGGSNILFGHSDINNGSSSNIDEPSAFSFLFTLVDNVKVSTFVAEDADFDSDSDVDGTDFLAWQRGNGIDDGTALLADGDANGDGNVNASDLAAWQGQYANGASQASLSTVPEPTSLLMIAMGLVSLTGVRYKFR